MRNTKFRVKLLLAFGIVLFLVAVSGVFSFYELEQSSLQVSFVTVDSLSALLDESETKENGTNLILAIRTYRLTESPEDLDTLKKAFNEMDKSLNDSDLLLKKFPRLDVPIKFIGLIRGETETFLKKTQEGIDMVAKKKALYNNLVEARKHAFDSMIELRNIVLKDVIDASKVNDDEAVVRRTKQLEIIGKISDMMAEVRGTTSRLVENKASKDLEELAVKQIEPLQSLIVELEALIFSQERKQYVMDIKVSFDNWEKAVKDFVQEHSATLNLFVNQVGPSQAEFAKTLKEYESELISNMQELSEETTSKLYLTRIVLVASLLMAIVIGVIVAFLFARLISKPLNKVVDLAKRAECGDLTIKKADFGYDGTDEIGTLVDAISSMVSGQEQVTRKVIELTKNVTDEAQTLAATSQETNASMEEIRASIQDVNRLSESNAAALEQSNAGISEMAEGASSVARSSTDGAEDVEKTGNITEKAVSMVESVIEEMNAVGKKSSENEDQIRKLAESVEHISSFVTVITNIADQTNLLALNAAIEAARAGEAGRGFAVVADEVRKLAEESGNAAKSVSQLISSLQANAKSAISGTRESAEIIKDTLHRAGDAQKALNESISSIKHVNEVIQNIAAVAEEQAASSKEMAAAISTVTNGMNEVNNRINAVHQSTDGASTAAENVATSAATLSSLAETLNRLLLHFKLDEVKQLAKR